MTKAPLNLACPSCKTQLLERSDHLECPSCHSTWPIVDGVPYFIQSSDNAGQTGLTQQVLQELVGRCSERNWHEVIKELPELKPYYQYISDLHRADWCALLDLGKESTVLDMGAGMGAVSQALSRRCRHVYSVEPVAERVQFMRVRFAQEGCTNISVIRAGIDSLPLPDNVFSLVVLNGVLEWLPFARKQDNPRSAQLYYLVRLRMLLKPGGVLYVGIENRLNYELLAGGCDPHIGLKGVAVMPRWMADLVCKRRLGDRYRPYLYAYRGYKKLMADAGFRACRVLSALPSYSDPQRIRPLSLPSSEFAEDVWVTKNRVSRMVKRIMVALDLLKYFGYAYVIFAEN